MEEGFLRNASTQGTTLMIYSILGRTPLQDTVAGTPSLSSGINNNSNPFRRAGRARTRNHTTNKSGTNGSFRRIHKQFNMLNEYFNSYSTFVWSPSYRLTPTLLVQLAEHNNRVMGTPGGKWLQVRAIVDCSSDLPTVGQGSNKDSQPLSQPVPQQDILGPQEG